MALKQESVTSSWNALVIQGAGKDKAATPKFEVKRHRAAGHSNDCMAVSLRRYSALNFAGCAISGSWIPLSR